MSVSKGQLYILSTGPGAPRYLTQEAMTALEKSTVIVGYGKYISDIQPLIQDKELFASGMTKEIQRCSLALEKALSGMTVALISNGDSNVFGLASLAIEIMDEQDLWDKIEVQTIPGVTSFLAAAAKTGAPISQDFCVISLSDRLTPIDLIEKRLKAAITGDFVIGIYNPLSKTRKNPYHILLRYLDQFIPERRPVIIASDVGRDMESIIYTTAGQLISQGVDNKDVSMSTLIIIGNQSTRWTKNKQTLTPRGYLNKYDINGRKK